MRRKVLLVFLANVGENRFRNAESIENRKPRMRRGITVRGVGGKGGPGLKGKEQKKSHGACPERSFMS